MGWLTVVVAHRSPNTLGSSWITSPAMIPSGPIRSAAARPARWWATAPDDRRGQRDRGRRRGGPRSRRRGRRRCRRWQDHRRRLWRRRPARRPARRSACRRPSAAPPPAIGSRPGGRPSAGWPAIHDDSTSSRRASSPSCGVSTAGTRRRASSSSRPDSANSPSASITSGPAVAASQVADDARSSSARPRPGPERRRRRRARPGRAPRPATAPSAPERQRTAADVPIQTRPAPERIAAMPVSWGAPVIPAEPPIDQHRSGAVLGRARPFARRQARAARASPPGRGWSARAARGCRCRRPRCVRHGGRRGRPTARPWARGRRRCIAAVTAGAGDGAGGRVDAGGHVERHDRQPAAVDLLDQRGGGGPRRALEAGAEQPVDHKVGAAQQPSQLGYGGPAVRTAAPCAGRSRAGGGRRRTAGSRRPPARRSARAPRFAGGGRRRGRRRRCCPSRTGSAGRGPGATAAGSRGPRPARPAPSAPRRGCPGRRSRRRPAPASRPRRAAAAVPITAASSTTATAPAMPLECVIERSIAPAWTRSANSATLPESVTRGFGRPAISMSRHMNSTPQPSALPTASLPAKRAAKCCAGLRREKQ